MTLLMSTHNLRFCGETRTIDLGQYWVLFISPEKWCYLSYFSTKGKHVMVLVETLQMSTHSIWASVRENLSLGAL